MKIPRIIHFIWAGGTFLMPPESVNVVAQWAKNNPEFEIWLWVDNKTSGSLDKLTCDYSKLFAQSHEFKTYNIQYQNHVIELTKGIPPTSSINIALKDIEEVASPYIRYEIDKLTPNYGASSDLLRYHILYKYGGAYFDSDVYPGQYSLQDSSYFDYDFSKHQLFVDYNSQNMGCIGNDAFICTQQNPLMLNLLTKGEQNYRLTEERDFHIMLTTAYASYDIKSITIGRTGPEHVNRNLDKGVNTIGNTEIVVSPLVYKDAPLTVSKGNSQRWLKVPVTKCEINQAIGCVLATIHFEAEYFKILRLDDHILHVSMASGIPEAEVAPLLIKQIEDRLDFSKLIIVQCTFRYQATCQFYESKQLNNKIFSRPDNGHYPATLMDISYYALLKEVLNSGDYKNLTPRDKGQFQLKMQQGLQFIKISLEGIIKYPESSKKEIKLKSRYIACLLDIIDIYEEFVSKCNLRFDLKWLSIEKIRLERKSEDLEKLLIAQDNDSTSRLGLQVP